MFTMHSCYTVTICIEGWGCVALIGESSTRSGLVLNGRQHPEVPLEALAAPGLEQLLLDCFSWEAQQRPTAQQALERLDAIIQQVSQGRAVS